MNRKPSHEQVVIIITYQTSSEGADQLQCYHCHSTQGELSITQVKEILQTRPKQLQYKSIILATRTEVVHLWNSICHSHK